MRQSAYGLVLLAVIWFCGGCIIPCPHIKETCGPINGMVVDDVDNIPIENARISIAYPDGGKRTTKTDANGCFSFPAKHRFHWGVLFGVALNHSLPLYGHAHGFTALSINADGYAKRSVYPHYMQHSCDRIDDPDVLYLKLGSLEGLHILLYKEDQDIENLPGWISNFSDK